MKLILEVADESEPVYKSKEHYQKLLEEHVAQLSSLQELHYASDRYAVLLSFRLWMRPEKMGHQARYVRVNPQGCQVFSFKHPSPANCNTIFSGAPLVIYRRAGGSASSTDPITRRC